MERHYLPVSNFDYSSAFTFNKATLDLDSNFDQFDSNNGRSKKYSNPLEYFMYIFLVTLSVAFFIITIPVSSFFCVKKVKSLQRCLTYRLGRRLPLKGPGYVFKLPFIDHVSIINLYDDQFYLIETDQQLLTSDGSIIVIKPCKASLNVTNAVLTKLKIGDINVKQCMRLRFSNMIRSKHVEDLENKTEFVVKEFEEVSNKFLRKWGFVIKLVDLPKLTVLERADPFNPIKSKIKKLFGQDDSSSSKMDSIPDDIMRFLNPISSLNINSQDYQSSEFETTLTKDELNRSISVMQTFVSQYQIYLAGFDVVNIKLTIHGGPMGQVRIQYFQCEQGVINSLPTAPDSHQLSVDFDSYANFEQFLQTKDKKYLRYSLH